MFTVYAHRSPSGKVYVGWTSRPRRRWNTHVNDAVKRMSPTPFHKAIRKYGPESFSHEVLEVMTTPEGARRAEQVWIKELGAFGPRGYNATLGGDGTAGIVVSSETRAKLAIARRKRTDSMRGFRHSAQSRANMSAAHKGKPNPCRQTYGLCACGAACLLDRGSCCRCIVRACACGRPCKPNRTICYPCAAANERARREAAR